MKQSTDERLVNFSELLKESDSWLKLPLLTGTVNGSDVQEIPA